MALVALASDAARVFGLVAVVLCAGLAIANVVAIAKLRGVSGWRLADVG